MGSVGRHCDKARVRHGVYRRDAEDSKGIPGEGEIKCGCLTRMHCFNRGVSHFYVVTVEHFFVVTNNLLFSERRFHKCFE